MNIASSVLVCAIVAAASPLLIRPLLRRAGVVDVPNDRSSHSRLVIRGGGLAPLGAILLGALAAPFAAPLWVVVAVGSAAGVLGFSDDVRSLSAKVRFGAQLLLGALLGVALVVALKATWWAIPLVMLLFAASVNMVNFMDGINGISALYGFVVGGAFVFLGVVSSLEWLVVAGALVGIAFLLFLPWNVMGSGMFLGDCGSYLLGAGTIAMAVAAIAAGAPWPAALAPFAVYATDTGSAIVGRLARRERVWEAHRRHQYQQLVDSGFPHLIVAAYVATFSLLVAAAGAISVIETTGSIVVSVTLVVLSCALYILISQGAIRFMRKKAR